MTINTLRGLIMLALACIGLAMPSDANAQAAPAVYEQVQTDEFSNGAQAFFNLVHLVPGLPLTRDDYRQLRTGDPVIYSAFNSAGLREVAEQHGWGSEKVRKYIDRRLSKEANIFTMHFQVGGMIVRITRWKGVDMDSNCTKGEGFIIADDSNGKPVFTHTSCNGNWQAVFSTAMASAMGQTATNVVTLGTQAGLESLTDPDCGSQCNPQQQFFISGGTAVASSESLSKSSAANANAINQATQVTIGDACGSGGVPCGAQPAGMVNPGPGNH